jgi:nicotinate-nucleotide adenylyltransferase
VKTGLLGGTFDPPHLGHLIVAQDAALALGLDRILFIPAALPPHKVGLPITPARLRVRMLELALAADPRFAIDPLELGRSGPSFTVDTLRDLHAREPGTEWTLLLGADQYAEFETWREPLEIRRLARVCVLSRGGDAGLTGAAGSTEAGASDVAAVLVTRIDISSTQVRRRVAVGQPIRYLVPEAVEQFIFEQGLYVRNGAPSAG